MDKDKSRKSEVVRHHIAVTVQNMILRSGIENVSARKAASEAGYSLGTIYNHFSGFDEVLWYSRSLMIESMGRILTAKSPDNIKNTGDLKKAFRAYMAYFIENPNVYRFFYFHTLKKEEKTVKNLSESPEFTAQMERSFAFLIQHKGFSQLEVTTIMKTIIFTIQGILTMIITDNDDVEVPSAYTQLDEIIDFLTEKNTKGDSYE